jgi:hypothetical protein
MLTCEPSKLRQPVAGKSSSSPLGLNYGRFLALISVRVEIKIDFMIHDLSNWRLPESWPQEPQLPHISVIDRSDISRIIQQMVGIIRSACIASACRIGFCHGSFNLWAALSSLNCEPRHNT